VEADVVLPQRGLVDLLVDPVLLGRELPQARGVDRVQAHVQAQRVVHLPETRALAGHPHPLDENRPVLDQVGLDLLPVL